MAKKKVKNHGFVDAVPAIEVKPGMILLFDDGTSHKVSDVKVSGKSVYITVISSDDSSYTYKKRSGTLIGLFAY
jgi:hypothetical protein